jgi:carboxypeptidase family protein
VLSGRVTTDVPPASPPGGVRPPGPIPGGSSAPVAALRVGITPVGSSHTWWVVTSVDGSFAIQLPPGTYRVTLEPRPGLGVARGLPETVTVVAGQPTSLDIRLDSGLR